MDMIMERCSPVDMRKNLETVEAFKGAGIDFVPIPVSSEFSKLDLLNLMAKVIDVIEKDVE